MASLPPFSATYSREVPDILAALGVSLVVSTYQAGKLILLSPSGESLTQLVRNFDSPMGLGVDDGRMAVVTRSELVVLKNVPSLAPRYPSRPGHYDALFVPRARYVTGPLALHDVAWSGDRIWAVNTIFSCLCHVDDRYSFTPRWQPPFVTALAPEDRCHLNGLAMDGGEPAYVTALGQTDTPGGWRADRLGGGVLLHVPSGEVVAAGLPMPHSPRLYDGRLYAVFAATGELVCVDPATGRHEVVNRVPGFARGIARCGDYLFLGHSRIRQKHIFGDLPIARREHYAGVVVLHLPSGRIAGLIRFVTSCEEIYDVQVLPGTTRPGIVGLDGKLHLDALDTPEASYWVRPAREHPERAQAADSDKSITSAPEAAAASRVKG